MRVKLDHISVKGGFPLHARYLQIIENHNVWIRLYNATYTLRRVFKRPKKTQDGCCLKEDSCKELGIWPPGCKLRSDQPQLDRLGEENDSKGPETPDDKSDEFVGTPMRMCPEAPGLICYFST